MTRDRITVVGAGKVGGTAAYVAATRHLGEIVLIDVVEGLAEGKALDIAQASPIQLSQQDIVGTTNWAATAGSAVVIVTSGAPRTPSMSRDDLLIKNAGIVQEVSRKVAEYSPNAIVIVVSNPLDATVHVAARATGFAAPRVLGMSGVLDAARFSYFLAAELGACAEDVNCMVIGGHGDDMVPLPRFSTVRGIPMARFLPQGTIHRLVDRTRQGGLEIVNLLGSSAFYAPAAGAVKMAEAILKDARSTMCCCAYCDKEYDVGGHFIGVPALLGAAGVEEIVELDLDESETMLFHESLGHIKKLTAQVDQLLYLPPAEGDFGGQETSGARISGAGPQNNN